MVRSDTVTLMLCGDVMTGRGIDQVLPYPGSPVLYEPYARSALDYVELAEKANGPVRKPVDFGYVWGDGREEMARRQPDLRIINLETAVTCSNDPAPKGINYRMAPRNVPCLAAAAIDCCVLANNHVLDWGRSGLRETLAVLDQAGLRRVGAGENGSEAAAPATFAIPGKSQVIIYAFACPSSGVPSDWAAGADRSGVNYLERPSAESAIPIAEKIRRDRQASDVVVVSIHWDANWGYEISAGDRAFAHALIEAGAADVIYGHSSHHPKAIEVYRGKPIVYGCGDLLNDYEGIAGHKSYRNDLALAYFVKIGGDEIGLVSLDMVPFAIRNFRLNRASVDDAEWVAGVMARECRRFGVGVALGEDRALGLLFK